MLIPLGVLSLGAVLAVVLVIDGVLVVVAKNDRKLAPMLAPRVQSRKPVWTAMPRTGFTEAEPVAVP